VGQTPRGRVAPRGSAGVAIVAATAVLVPVSVIAAGLGAGAIWVFEVLAATGLLVGLGVAFGAFDRGPSTPRGQRRGGHEAQVSPELTASVEAALRALDPVEHRRLDLGSPWPTVVVGPTGVTVIAVGGKVGASTATRAHEILVQVRRATRRHAGDRPIAVRALLVVPDDQVPAEPGQADVRAVSVADLADVVTRGPIVSMATVAALFTELTGELAPDLQAHAV
jgi:hypothetical protein